MELYGRVRLAVLRDGLGQREAARRFGLDRGTVAKMLKHSVPPGYTRVMPVRPAEAGGAYRLHRSDPGRGRDGAPQAAPHGPTSFSAHADGRFLLRPSGRLSHRH